MWSSVNGNILINQTAIQSVKMHEVTRCKQAHYELSITDVLDFVHTSKRQKAIRTHGLEASKCPV